MSRRRKENDASVTVFAYNGKNRSSDYANSSLGCLQNVILTPAKGRGFAPTVISTKRSAWRDLIASL